MTPLATKIVSILSTLEERGQVYLFALAEREDIDAWDIVLSSDWSDKNWTEAIGIITDLLYPLLTSQERVAIARIAVVPSSDPRVQEMPSSLDGVTPKDQKIIYVNLLGSDVRRAFIFKAQHPPAVTSATLELAVAHA